MALQAVVTSSTAAGVRVDAGTSDDVFVAQGVALASTDNIAITAYGSNQRVDVLGTVVGGYQAIGMGNDRATDHDQYLFVAKTGYLAGYSSGQYSVRIDAFNSTLENQGTILGLKGYAVSIGGLVTDTTSTVLNTGKIEGKYQAIDHFGSDNLVLTNTGTITGIYDGAEAKDTITNNGNMSGDIYLYGGDDVFDSRGGAYSGTVYGGNGKDTIYGSSKADTLTGGADNDRNYGGSGNDILKGDDGNDYLSGGTGLDKLTGGLGKDLLNGGADADTFIFLSVADSTVGTAGLDTILDFSQAQKDKIDLSAIDAKVSTGIDNSFTFIGTAAYSQKEGELRYKVSGGDTFIYGDTNGDGSSDFKIALDGTFTLKATDFIL